MSSQQRLRPAVEGAIIVAFAMVLSFIPHTVGVSAIEVQYGLIPITLYALRRGFPAALMAGLIWGLLDMFLRGIPGGSVLNAFQGFLEYPLAFTAVGVAGIWASAFRQAVRRDRTTTAKGFIVLAALAGGIAKYACHFLAGIVFWGSYAPAGQSPVLYSLVINGGSAVASVTLAVVVLLITFRVAPQLFVVKNRQ